MGLDMYLMGDIYHGVYDMSHGKYEEKPLPCLEEESFRLGYWRKHPNLHGYIVKKFADGKDECQRIDLNIEALLAIIEAVKAKILPHTEGFFFGKSEGTQEELNADLIILRRAAEWLAAAEENFPRSVYYRASW